MSYQFFITLAALWGAALSTINFIWGYFRRTFRLRVDLQGKIMVKTKDVDDPEQTFMIEISAANPGYREVVLERIGIVIVGSNRPFFVVAKNKEHAGSDTKITIEPGRGSKVYQDMSYIPHALKASSDINPDETLVIYGWAQNRLGKWHYSKPYYLEIDPWTLSSVPFWKRPYYWFWDPKKPNIDSQFVTEDLVIRKNFE